MSDRPDPFCPSTQRAAELWLALVKDVTAKECQFPCLRDDLTDWLKQHLKSALLNGDSRD